MCFWGTECLQDWTGQNLLSTKEVVLYRRAVPRNCVKSCTVSYVNEMYTCDCVESCNCVEEMKMKLYGKEI